MMCDIKLEVKGPGTCRGCLSSDRKLTSVRQQHSSCDLYYSLLTEEQKLEAVSLPHIPLCWECIAILRRTQRFREQVQKAHTILQKSKQLLSADPTLSSLTFHRKLKYDAILKENQPYEIPLFHEAQKATIDNDKIIIPTKYNSTATRSNVETVKNIKDVINDLLSNAKIKKEVVVELPSNDTNNSYDSEDNIIFEADDRNFSSSDEISEVEEKPKVLQKDIQPKQNSKPLKNKVTKPIKTKDNVENSGDDSEDDDIEKKPKRKRQKKSELDPDFNLEDNDNYASTDSENFKLIRIKLRKEQSDTDPNLTIEGDEDDTKITKKRQRTFRKTITKYKDIAELSQYFTEIEMSEEDIKITLEKDDAIVDKRLNKKPIKCIVCGLMFRQRQTLTNHGVRLHKAQYPNQMEKGCWVNPPPIFPQKSVWQCNVCARMMRKEHIIAHMNEYHRTQYFCIGDGCEWCQKPFWNKQDLDQHWEEIHKQFMCDYCDKYKKTKMRLETHIQDSHASRVKYVTNQCKFCMKVLSSIHALKLHYAYIHEKNNEPLEQRYCVECNLTFKRIKGYEKHFNDKHSGRPKPSGYPCETCGKVLANKVTFRNHVDLMHNGKTPHYCHVCGKYLSKQDALNRHLDSHNNVKTPKTKPCTVCGRMFQYNRELRMHMYTHTGERPYKCTHCETAFTQPHCLRVHLAKQHHVDARVRTDGTIIEASKTES